MRVRRRPSEGAGEKGEFEVGEIGKTGDSEVGNRDSKVNEDKQKCRFR